MSVAGVEVAENPRPLQGALIRLKRLGRRLSRRVKGSGRWKKAKLAMARAYTRVCGVRGNFLHQLTSRLVKRYGTVVIEDLSVKGLARTKLARSVQDAAWGEFRRQLTYKAETAGTRIVVADRFFPSSKKCSKCGTVKAELTLGERTYRCDHCGLTRGRDENAAANLLALALPGGLPGTTPVEGKALARLKGRAKPAPVKREARGVHDE
jgi:putative transposase